jgi:hypothetical protein
MSPLPSLVDITSRHQHIWHAFFIFTGQHQTSLTSSSHGNTPTHSQVEYTFGQGLRARLAYASAYDPLRIRFAYDSHTHTIPFAYASHTISSAYASHTISSAYASHTHTHTTTTRRLHSVWALLRVWSRIDQPCSRYWWRMPHSI